jgi:hypothetical protein
MWVPTTVSPAVSVFLFTLAAELGRVTQSKDGMKLLEETRTHTHTHNTTKKPLPSSSRKPTPNTHTHTHTPLQTTILESFRVALVKEARRVVEDTYTHTHTLNLKEMGENATLQAVLDLHFLKQWLGGEASGRGVCVWV